MFFSSEEDNDNEHVMHSKSDNIEIIFSDEADEVLKKHFDSLKNNLESMRGLSSNTLLYYKCHKINLNCDGSYIDSPD